MYGHHIHEAVLNAGEKESGISIHFVNEEYDEGTKILQAYCPILPQDNVKSLTDKVRKLEHSFYPKTIEYLLSVQ
jgi:phosphoribosylglycinamide formyltransferase-1